MYRVLEILRFSFLTLTVNSVHCAGSKHTVTSRQHGEAVLSFHFSFISGPEDLGVTIMKMGSISDTNPTVIYVIDNGAEEYYAAQYRNRAEIHNDLSSGKLELILKHVEESDAGIYKCQAANKKNHEEKMIQLYIKLPVKPTEIMAAEGESVTFRADFSGPRTEVVWKIGEDKLVEVEENSSHYYRLADRASAFFHTGSLTIRDLVESDSGHYSRNILTEGKYHETKFILKVSPSKPEIHYIVTNGAITVYCISNSTGVTYEWRNSSGDLLYTGAVYIAPPETLRINDTVTCIVKNKVSESSSSVIIHYLPEEIAHRNRNPSIASVLTLMFLISFLWYKMPSRKSQEHPEKLQGSTCEEYPEKLQGSTCEEYPVTLQRFASEEHPEKLHRFACDLTLLYSQVNPYESETICDTDSKYKIKDTAENNPCIRDESDRTT